MPSKKREVEERYGKPLKEVLLTLFEQYNSQTAIAQELGVSQSTVSLWMTLLGLRIEVTKNAVSAVSVAEGRVG